MDDRCSRTWEVFFSRMLQSANEALDILKRPAEYRRLSLLQRIIPIQAESL
jgi:hypothetical protein